MAQDTHTNKDLALLLFSGEWAGGSNADELQSAVQRTFEKLNEHLAKRLGSGGYYALIKRAVTLAAADFPWLTSIQITKSGILEGFDPVFEVRTIPEIAEGCVAILASLIGLLETFIGRELCLRMLHTVWPNAIQPDTNVPQGESNG